MQRRCKDFLSTPSLGITIARFSCFIGRVKLFQLPLSGSHFWVLIHHRPVAIFIVFQLPLSGSHRHRTSENRWGAWKLSTPSLGITVVANPAPSDMVVLPLSTPSLGITIERPSDRIIFRSHNFQLPLSGSREFREVADRPSDTDILSTPSLGITCRNQPN